MKKILQLVLVSLLTCSTAMAGNVTFSVDMNEFVGIPFTSVYVNGTWNSWCGDCNPLSNNGDGVWEVTLEIPDGTHEFKYTLDGWTGQEELTPGSACTVTNGEFTNRLVEVAGEVNLPTVCWNGCEACGSAPDLVSVTINVNMINEVVAETGVFVAGGASFGSPGDNELTDPDGDGIYSITLERPLGFSSHYTFLNGNCPDYSCKENISGQPCADPYNFNDRFMGPVDAPLTISTCFGECTDDGSCPDPVPPTAVTFQVDAKELAVGDGIFMGASFDGWSGGIALDDSDGDDIWSVTIDLTPGQYEYKFINGSGWAGPEDLSATEDAACTLTSGEFTNRLVVVGEDQLTLDAVCFNSCEACVDNGLEDVQNEITVNTFDANNSIVLTANIPAPKSVRLFSATGQLVQEVRLSAASTQHSFDTANLASGLYIVQVATEGVTTSQKIIVK